MSNRIIKVNRKNVLKILTTTFIFEGYNNLSTKDILNWDKVTISLIVPSEACIKTKKNENYGWGDSLVCLLLTVKLNYVITWNGAAVYSI